MITQKDQLKKGMIIFDVSVYDQPGTHILYGEIKKHELLEAPKFGAHSWLIETQSILFDSGYSKLTTNICLSVNDTDWKESIHCLSTTKIYLSDRGMMQNGIPAYNNHRLFTDLDEAKQHVMTGINHPLSETSSEELIKIYDDAMKIVDYMW